MNSFPQTSSIKEIKNWFCESLERQYSKPESQAIFFLVVKQKFGLDRVQVLVDENEHMSESGVASLAHVLAKLKQGIPVQYVIGSMEFYGLILYVNSFVLIPRPETEELVEWILNENQSSGQSVIDLGSGSGCIALVLKKERPDWQVTALEKNEGAVNVIRENAKVTQLDVRIIQGDMLEKIEGQFDILVSNPPYIERSRRGKMAGHVVEHEPEIALFVPDDDPLKFYKAIVQIAKRNLKPGGRIYCEINEALHMETKSLFESSGLKSPTLRKDLNGHWRMIRAEK